MAKTYYPGPEKVAIAFLKTLPGLPTNQIASTLPTDRAVWTATGFIQVQTTGGSPMSDIPVSGPVMTVDVWANVMDAKGKIPWGKAENLAETVKQVVNRWKSNNLVLNMGDDFLDVSMHSAWTITEPRRVEDDPSGYARFTLEVEMRWSTP